MVLSPSLQIISFLLKVWSLATYKISLISFVCKLSNNGNDANILNLYKSSLFKDFLTSISEFFKPTGADFNPQF